MSNKSCKNSLTVAAAVFATLPVMAQQTTGLPGAPNATTTISGRQLPPPDPKFGGGIIGAYVNN
jgi:arylsulfatase